ncbi:hypothetical protein [Clostridium gasigenes]|nr:hypothetical protein [Clostridium gasigenes]MBU3107181.1 hypothetical protein [Clostridium gasigenes]
MKMKTEMINGKRKVILIREASGEDRVKEAMILVLQGRYEFSQEKV